MVEWIETHTWGKLWVRVCACMYAGGTGYMCVRYVCKHAYGVPVSTSGVFPRSYY